MSEKTKSARYSQSRTDTMIGSGARVEGNVTFTGVLHIQGEILGNVSCDADSNGTIVVDQSGKLTGAIKAPHIVVSGHIHGPLQSTVSIEIQPGARCVGDAIYKLIEIHAGGVIEGALTPMALMDRDQSKLAHRTQFPEPPAVKERGTPPANAVPADSRYWPRLGRGPKLGAAGMLIIALVTIVLMNRDPTPIAPPAADLALKSSATVASMLQSTPMGSEGLQDGPRAVAGDAVSLAPSSDADVQGLVQTPPSYLPATNPEKVVMVQGVNPGKPAGVFSVISKEPSVLSRKKRQDPGKGTLIDISKGAAISIAIGKSEIFRVAKGQNIEIFYQGRKVAPKIIESGTWMGFVPQSSSGTTDNE